MAYIEPRPVRLKDGRELILRTGDCVARMFGTHLTSARHYCVPVRLAMRGCACASDDA